MKRKNKYKIAKNSNTEVVTPYTATNAIEEALKFSGCNYDFQSLGQLKEALYNINPLILSNNYYLMTYLPKTFGLLNKIINIPVDYAFKGGGYTLEGETFNEIDLKKIVR